jgi:DNA-binding response OmpR family regulator
MRRILVIDDELLVRQTLRLALEKSGYDVACASDGRDGVERFRALAPDLVITDIIMPDQEGIETIRQIRGISCSVPIIAISGGSPQGNADYLRVARGLGATDVLYKPFSREALLAKVSTCLPGPA